MQFNQLKNMCYEHDKILKKIDIIEDSNKNKTWLKIINPRGNEFYLSDIEIDILMECINKKKLEIEKIINKL